jgi:hypothetical protein
LNPFGSTPNIGDGGGNTKLSVRSTLIWNDGDASPDTGSASITIPFSMPAEQLDFNSNFDSAQEDWTGYEVIAKFKVQSDGDMTDCVGAWIYSTSAGYVFARGPRQVVTEAQGWVDLYFDPANPDDVGGQPSNANYDITHVNQLGIHLHTYDCPAP